MSTSSQVFGRFFFGRTVLNAVFLNISYESSRMKASFYKLQFLMAFVVLGTLGLNAQAQIRESIEPPELPAARAKTAFQEGLRTGWLARFVLSDNGFALGTEVRKVANPYTEFIFSVDAGGLRDSREQIFNSFYFGQITPNKYRRVISMPVQIGFRQRLFAHSFDDNFRLNLATSVGPTAAFVFPYFRDSDQNGIRDSDEIYYDVFRGWNDGEFMFGGAGKVGIGIDFGDRFKRVTTFEFGYQVQYFANGIQIMQPNAYELIFTPGGQIGLDIVPGASKQSVFGTPTISLSFGRFW
jgi:hypothetical protein